MATALNRFVWTDLSTTDPAAAKAFYTQLLGWSTTPHNDDYDMWINGDQALGGIMLLPEQAKAMGTPPHWLAYVGVDDVAAAVDQAKALGAQVHVPATDIPEVGRFAVLADPTGAVFAVYQSPEAHGEQPDAGVGDFSWGELYTGDLDAASGFYTTLFGWQTEDQDMGPTGTYRLFKNPDMGKLHMGGMCGFPPGMPQHAAWLHYVTVSDLDGAISKVKDLGGQVLNGPMEVSGGDRIAQCIDPQGAAFALHQGPS